MPEFAGGILLSDKTFRKVHGDGTAVGTDRDDKVVVERNHDLPAVGSAQVGARSAGDVLEIRDDAGHLAVSGKHGPSGHIDKVLIFRLIRIRIGIYIPAREFLGIGKGVDPAQVDHSPVSALRLERGEKKRNRKSVKLDEHRFLSVHIIRIDIAESEYQITFGTVGFQYPGNLKKVGWT